MVRRDQAIAREKPRVRRDDRRKTRDRDERIAVLTLGERLAVGPQAQGPRGHP